MPYEPTPDERRVIEWLRAKRNEAQHMAEGLPWWRFKLRFANFCAAAACNHLRRELQQGHHRHDRKD